MRIIKTSNGKQSIQLSPEEWIKIGERKGWIKKALWEKLRQQVDNLSNLGNTNKSNNWQNYDSRAQLNALAEMESFAAQLKEWINQIKLARKKFHYSDIDNLFRNKVLSSIAKFQDVVSKAVQVKQVQEVKPNVPLG